MHFMSDSEHLLLMNLCPSMDITHTYGFLSVDDRKRLFDAGIRTAIEYPEWGLLEPAQGIYNFSSIETILNMNRSVGMKTIFSVPGPYLPAWIPNAWRYKYSDGTYNTASVSMWNMEAAQYQQNFLHKLVDTYHSDDVMFILGLNDTGESMFPAGAYYDDCAVQDYKTWYGKDTYPNESDGGDTKNWLEESLLGYFIGLQEDVFYPQFHEIWDAHQWLIAQKSPGSMNYFQPNLLNEYRFFFGSGMSLVLLQYTYFDDSHPHENEVYVDMLKEKYNCEVIVEAMFCAGLPTTTPKAKAKGFRGQIICPTHPHVNIQHLDNSMIQSIRNSVEIWKS